MKHPAPIRRCLVACMGVLLLSSSPAFAQDEFLGVGGGDLADPNNWSAGVVPEQGEVNQSGALNFTISKDTDGPSLALLGSDTDATFDLLGYTWNSGRIIVVPDPGNGSQRIHVRNGRLEDGGVFNLPSSQTIPVVSETTLSNLDASNSRFWKLLSYDELLLTVDNQSSIQSVDAHSDRVHVLVDHGSQYDGISPNPGLDSITGLTSARLAVDHDSRIIGPVKVESDGEAEVVIRGGSTTDPNASLNVEAPSCNILIEGSGTDVTLAGLYVGSFPLPSYLTKVMAKAHITDGAQVQFKNDRPAVESPQWDFFLPSQFSHYGHRMGSLEVTGQTTSLDVQAPLGVISIEVTDGATYQSNQTTDVVGDFVLRDADATTVLRSVLGPVLGQQLLGSNDVVIQRGTLTGNVNGFLSLQLDDGTVHGDVYAYEIRGGGTIVGNVSMQTTSMIAAPSLRPDGVLEITGDIPRLEFLEQHIGGVIPGLEFDQLVLGGNIPYLGHVIGPNGSLDWQLIFDPGFHACVGDRLELIQVNGMTLDFSAVFHQFPNSDPSDIIRAWLLTPELTDLPDGYQLDFFIDEHAIGFEVATVPEVPTRVLVSGVLAAILSMRLFRRSIVT